MVLIGGSGASDRHNDGLFDALREHLVIAGLAVMTYDKRGTGESTGAWAGATVDQLATDSSSAALGTLTEQDDVTTDRVSAFGHSEDHGGASPMRPHGIPGSFGTQIRVRPRHSYNRKCTRWPLRGWTRPPLLRCLADW